MSLETKGLYKNAIKYSITINPADEGQFWTDNELNRSLNCIKFAYELVTKYLKPYATYELYPELSRRGRWHYHGTVTFTDTFGFHLTGIRKLTQYSNIDIDTIGDDKTWLEYCTKDRNIMENILTPFYVLTSRTVIENSTILNTRKKYARDLGDYFQ